MTGSPLSKTATDTRPDQDTRLRGPWLALARAAVVAYGVTFLILFIVGVPVHFRALSSTVCAPVETCELLYLSAQEIAAMPRGSVSRPTPSTRS